MSKEDKTGPGLSSIKEDLGRQNINVNGVTDITEPLYLLLPSPQIELSVDFYAKMSDLLEFPKHKREKINIRGLFKENRFFSPPTRPKSEFGKMIRP